MAKNSRKRKNKKSRGNSSLDQHRKIGKTLHPPLNSLPIKTTLSPWLQDDFPDMLWVCSLIVLNGDEGIKIALSVLRIINDICRENGVELEQPLTGQLTKFDLVPVTIRPVIIQSLRDLGAVSDGIPWLFIRALEKYPEAPALWLRECWTGHEEIVPANAPENLLRSIINACGHGQSEDSTKVKYVFLSALNMSGKFHVEDGIREKFARYPQGISEEELRNVRPNIRSMYLASKGALSVEEDPRANIWAKVFWRTNWKLSDCEIPQLAHGEYAPTDQEGASAESILVEWDAQFEQIRERFLESSRKCDPDLYSPDRYEVLSGILARQIRAVDVLMKLPPLWTEEHGSGVTRTLIEAHILFRWLVQHKNEQIFSEFKSHGRGNLKLYKLHLEKLRDARETSDEGLQGHIEYLKQLVNQDVDEEFQDINIGSFGGIDTRKMAKLVGLESDYSVYFAPASSRVHGDWSMLDSYVLTQCINPLHRRHRIPALDVSPRYAIELVAWVLERLNLILLEYQAAIGG